MSTHMLQFSSSEIDSTIRLLISTLVSLSDSTGQFLNHLDDGRVIDTKGWNDWDWTHGIGLRSLWAYYKITGDRSILKHITQWVADRFAVGGTSKNVNTMCVMHVLAAVYEEEGRDQRYLPQLEAWAE